MNDNVNRYLNINPPFNYSAVCMYINTPDEHFIIDYHPDNKNIIIGSQCLGHGLIFSSSSGKILTDMALEKKAEFDMKPFAIDRFFTR